MSGQLIKGISNELENMVLSLIMFEPNIYDSTKDVIQSSFFKQESKKLLYKALRKFHKDTKTMPSFKDMMIEIKLLTSDTEMLIEEKQLLQQLQQLYLDEYINKDDDVKINFVEEFVKRNGLNSTLLQIVTDAKEHNGVDYDVLETSLKKYTDFNIVQTEAFNLCDITKFEKLKTQSIGNETDDKKIKFFLSEINDTLNHNGLTPGTLTMVCAPPGVGKTLSLINQGVSATQDGFTSLHIFIGDLTYYDASIRYLASYAKKPLKEILEMTTQEQQNLINTLSNNVNAAINKAWVVTVASGSITVEQLIHEIEKMQIKNNVHFDQIIVDYDANIKPSGDDMYKNGGDVYNKLRAFAARNSTIMLVASQPKVAFFAQEILTLDAASESSQKQHICDLVLTIGRPGKTVYNLATLFVAKNRNGRVNKVIRLYIDGATQTVNPLPESEYERLKRESVNNN